MIERPALLLLNSLNGSVPDSDEIRMKLIQTKNILETLKEYKIPCIKSGLLIVFTLVELYIVFDTNTWISVRGLFVLFGVMQKSISSKKVLFDIPFRTYLTPN